MSTMELVKTAYDFLVEAKRLDLAEIVIGLRAELIEVKEKNLLLKEENSELNKQLETKANVVFEKGICWLKDDELTESDAPTPICPKCYQKSGIVIRTALVDKLRL